jgi:hypothetical protein
VDVIEDTVKGQLIGIRQGQLDALNDAQKADFKKRKLLVEVYVCWLSSLIIVAY